MMRLPSGDHAASQSAAGSEVSRAPIPRVNSYTHISDAKRPPRPGRACRLTATRVPSRERATVLYRPGSPTIPKAFPDRSNQVSLVILSGDPLNSPVLYANTPVTETENARGAPPPMP